MKKFLALLTFALLFAIATGAKESGMSNTDCRTDYVSLTDGYGTAGDYSTVISCRVYIEVYERRNCVWDYSTVISCRDGLLPVYIEVYERRNCVSIYEGAKVCKSIYNNKKTHKARDSLHEAADEAALKVLRIIN
jgi:hypothetical protein